jgi:hypothetical protein
MRVEEAKMGPALTERIVAAFCDGSLPKEEWTHHAHLLIPGEASFRSIGRSPGLGDDPIEP